jgi:DNA-binding FadR family transcriptional regulator
MHYRPQHVSQNSWRQRLIVRSMDMMVETRALSRPRLTYFRGARRALENIPLVLAASVRTHALCIIMGQATQRVRQRQQCIDYLRAATSAAVVVAFHGTVATYSCLHSGAYQLCSYSTLHQLG